MIFTKGLKKCFIGCLRFFDKGNPNFSVLKQKFLDEMYESNGIPLQKNQLFSHFVKRFVVKKDI